MTARRTWTRCSIESTPASPTLKPGSRCRGPARRDPDMRRAPSLGGWDGARGPFWLGPAGQAPGAAWPAGVLGDYFTWVTMVFTIWTAWVSHLAYANGKPDFWTA